MEFRRVLFRSPRRAGRRLPPVGAVAILVVGSRTNAAGCAQPGVAGRRAPRRVSHRRRRVRSRLGRASGRVWAGWLTLVRRYGDRRDAESTLMTKSEVILL